MLAGPFACSPPPARIAVFRALQLGDLLCAVPALRALRVAFPAASVTLIGLPWAQAFVQRFAHLIDGFVPFPGHPRLPEREPDRAAFPRFVAEQRAQRYDLVLQMHGRGEITNRIALAVRGRITAGFFPHGGRCPWPGRFRAWPEQGTEVERCLALTDFLGLPRRGEALEFPLTGAERRAHVARLRAHALLPGGYVCIHPGARLASRRWPPERFAAIAARLAAQGHRIVVTGSFAEADLARTVADAAGACAVNLCDRTALGDLAALIGDARLLVCNDTGVSHIAAALRTASVVVSCGADAARFAPADSLRHRVIAHATACRPCMHARCPTAHECATGVTVAEVATAVQALLERHPGVAERRQPAHAQ